MKLEKADYKAVIIVIKSFKFEYNISIQLLSDNFVIF